MTIVVIGVDPGESCGIAELTDGILTYVAQETPEFMLAQLRSRLGLVMLAYSPDITLTVVCERFVQRQSSHVHRSNQPKALEVSGAVEDICVQAGIPFALQNPADAKGLASNDLLRKLKLWVTPSQLGTRDANDARDAIRHALLRVATKHAVLFAQLLRDAGGGVG